MANFLDQLDTEIANVEQKALETAANKKEKKKNFGKSMEMSFIDGVLGNYEMRPVMDDKGLLKEEVILHTIKGPGKTKYTVTCKGNKGEPCEICEGLKKLRKLGNKVIYKFAYTYTMKKLFIQIGKIQTGAKDLKPNTIYVAYCGDDYYNNLLNALKIGKEYYPEKLQSLLDYTKATDGGAFLASTIKSEKSTTYSFQWIDKIVLSPLNEALTELEKTELLLANEGWFRANFIQEEKFKSALGLVTSAINYQIKQNESKGKKSEGSAPAGGDGDAGVDSSSKDMQELANKAAKEEKDKQENPDRPEGAEECFGNFQSTDGKCLKCEFNRPCIEKFMGKS